MVSNPEFLKKGDRKAWFRQMTNITFYLPKPLKISYRAILKKYKMKASIDLKNYIERRIKAEEDRTEQERQKAERDRQIVLSTHGKGYIKEGTKNAS